MESFTCPVASRLWKESMFFLAAVELREQKRLALLDWMAAMLPSMIPKGILNMSLT